jgi:hypothetical protein
MGEIIARNMSTSLPFRELEKFRRWIFVRLSVPHLQDVLNQMLFYGVLLDCASILPYQHTAVYIFLDQGVYLIY